MATATATPVMKFRLKVGTHVSTMRDKEGKPVIDPKTGRNKTIKHEASNPRTCLIDSTDDLAARFGRTKFEPIYGQSTRALEESHPEVYAFEKMTVSQLKEYAEEDEIDIEGMKTKVDIINGLRKAIAEREAE